MKVSKVTTYQVIIGNDDTRRIMGELSYLRKIISDKNFNQNYPTLRKLLSLYLEQEES